MCGFVAIIQKQENTKLPIWKLADAIKNRGPDDWGWLSYKNSETRLGREKKDISGQVLFAHRRLSIIDLSENGWQPMTYEDGRFAITYNGEIYNYLELKETLTDKGYSFSSTSDTEVILASWAEWGVDAPAKFRGMFAFCLLDKKLGRMFVVRDHFGIKPAYYCEWDNGLAFSSDHICLQMLPGTSRSLDQQKVYESLRFGMSDRGEKTIYKDIKQVLPASILEFDIKTQTLVNSIKYWEINPKKNNIDTFEEATKKVRDLFLESIELHLRSDVLIGAALSGGIDSSAIVCAIRHLRPNAELHTFTYIAEDDNLSEEKWADIVVEHTNAIAHKVKPSSENLVNNIEMVNDAQGEPYSSTSIFAQFKVFELAKQNKIKVMLDGQGADEMLGGYTYYQGSRLATMIKKGQLLAALKFIMNSTVFTGRKRITLLLHLGNILVPQWIVPYLRNIVGKSMAPPWFKKKWLKRNSIKTDIEKFSDKTNGDHLRSHLIDSLSGLAHLLRYEDRNSMYHSVESRVPFLLPELANYLVNLPECYLINETGVSKHVFREAMRGIVPDVILDRKDKVGFETPQADWMRQIKDATISKFDGLKNKEMVDFQLLKENLLNFPKMASGVDERAIWRNVNLIDFINKKIKKITTV